MHNHFASLIGHLASWIFYLDVFLGSPEPGEISQTDIFYEHRYSSFCQWNRGHDH